MKDYNFKKYNAFIFNPIPDKQLLGGGREPIKNFYTKEQMIRIAIRILEKEAEILKAEGYKLTKI